MKEELPANHANKRQNKRLVDDLIFKEEVYAIIGACFLVDKDKGCGFLEPVYQECMEIELNYRKIHARPKPSLLLTYRGITLRQTYEPDLICYDKIILELKAVEGLADQHRAQGLNYLNATGLELGLLVNLVTTPVWNGSAS
jgi:GxxExxY protein